MKFKDLGLHDKLLDTISYMGFESATPVQEKVIPVILEGRDLIACAQTGTGKTGAFVLPVLDKLINKEEAGIDTLILVPTRELAVQIEQQIQGFSYFIAAEAIAVYGGGDGNNWEAEKLAFRNGTELIIATPGRLMTHLKMGNIDFRKLTHLILDEADRMLDMGFIDDIKTIISFLPVERQTLMFSATMPANIRQLAQTILTNPVEVSLSISVPAEGVDQKAYLLFDEQKTEVIRNILNERQHFDSILIFTSTKSKISEIVRTLNRNGFPSKGISSNLEQSEREEVLRQFRSKRLRILVATDVMSRGIDVKEINLVLNFDVPHDPEDYVHRVGRTARINGKGEAITFVTPREVYKIRKIEKLIKNSIPKIEPPAEIGVVPSWEDSETFKKQGVKKRRWGKGKKKG